MFDFNMFSKREWLAIAALFLIALAGTVWGTYWSVDHLLVSN
jgi:hypothetical protein